LTKYGKRENKKKKKKKKEERRKKNLINHLTFGKEKERKEPEK